MHLPTWVWPLFGVAILALVVVRALAARVRVADVPRLPGERDLAVFHGVRVRGKVKPYRTLEWPGMRVFVTSERFIVATSAGEPFVEYDVELVRGDAELADRNDGRPQYLVRRAAVRRSSAREVFVPIEGEFVRTHMAVPTELHFETEDADKLFALLREP